MKKALLWTFLLAGCATQSGVLPEGKDAYLLIMSSGHGFASATDLRIDAHKEASKFCRNLHKRPETVFENTTQSGMVSDFHEEELKFRCVDDITSPAYPGGHVAAASAVPQIQAGAH